MKIKIVGFKVGESRPTANHGFQYEHDEENWEVDLGRTVDAIISKSDFISIRRVDE